MTKDQQVVFDLVKDKLPNLFKRTFLKAWNDTHADQAILKMSGTHAEKLADMAQFIIDVNVKYHTKENYDGNYSIDNERSLN